MAVPTATYRLQLTPEFGFSEATRQVTYLARLGISTAYLSPVLAARSGSHHGYDVTDPTRLNPELGTADEFRNLVEELQRNDLNVLLDIVPNHMAATHENPWWVETLAKGPNAPHARVFDIDWHSTAPGLQGKVLLPFLGKPLTEVLSAGELSVVFEDGRFWVRYFEDRYPLSWDSVRPWLEEALDRLGNPASDLLEARDAIDKSDIYERVAAMYETDAAFRDSVGIVLERINENGSSHDELEATLAKQHYRLAYWRTATDEINYRRFFSITDLIGVRIEDPSVFSETHAFIFDLVRRGHVHGLRVDHIDGLAEPAKYLRRLQSEAETADPSHPHPFYVVVEKVLCGDETLARNWPVAGTTGYEFLDHLNRLFVDPEGLGELQTAYAAFVGTTRSYDDVRYEKKKEIVDSLFAGELRGLAAMLKALAASDRRGRDISAHQLEIALRELTVSLDVYRTYLGDSHVTETDSAVVQHALAEVAARNPLVDSYTLDFLRYILLDTADGDAGRQRFVQRWQQFTGPVMAKGVEDTTHYSYFPLCSMNEVGAEANNPAIDLDEFHRWNAARLEHREMGLNATSTHDTKRSEDVRARISLLSEMPEWWRKAQQRWSQWHRSKRVSADGLTVPDPVLETLIYQTLLGVWPLESDDVPSMVERVKDYLVKAARERKEYTRWIATNVSYEDAVRSFVDAILEDTPSNRFLAEFRHQQRRIARWGHLNSLSQLLLKIASPGVPDIYRGTELWDFSLVDPDNRRPVDYEKRDRMLRDLDIQFRRRPKSLFQQLNTRWHDGLIKLFVTARGLRCRRGHAELFLKGSYIPLYSNGSRRRHVCSFARRHDSQWGIAVAPRLVVRLSRVPKAPLGRAVWGHETLALTDEMPSRWRDALTNEVVETENDGTTRGLPLRSALRHLPVALLIAES